MAAQARPGPAHIPLFLWYLPAPAALVNLQDLLQNQAFLEQLFEQTDLQRLLSGCDWSHVQTDTRQFLPPFELAEGQRPIVLLTALQRLVQEHLLQQLAGHLNLVRIQGLVSYLPAATGLYLEFICEGQLSDSALTTIVAHLQND